jgi:hypothetical protein
MYGQAAWNSAYGLQRPIMKRSLVLVARNTYRQLTLPSLPEPSRETPTILGVLCAHTSSSDGLGWGLSRSRGSTRLQVLRKWRLS